MSRRVVVYSKPGCHLCEDALRLLHDLRGEYDLAIEEIDISTNPILFKKYFEKIPVVLMDDRVTLCPPITRQDILRALSSD